MTSPLILPPPQDLLLIGAFLPGVPNEERLYLRSHNQVNLGEYFLTTGWKITESHAIPLQDHVLWLGNQTIDAGWWVVVYTGPGQLKMTSLPGGEPAVVLHWGKQHTLFHQMEIVPILLHVDAARVGGQVRPTALQSGADATHSERVEKP